VNPDTIAKSLAIRHARRTVFYGSKVMRAPTPQPLSDDDEIRDTTIKLLARREGIFAEEPRRPASWRDCRVATQAAASGQDSEGSFAVIAYPATGIENRRRARSCRQNTRNSAAACAGVRGDRCWRMKKK